MSLFPLRVHLKIRATAFVPVVGGEDAAWRIPCPALVRRESPALFSLIQLPAHCSALFFPTPSAAKKRLGRCLRLQLIRTAPPSGPSAFGHWACCAGIRM